MTGANVLLVDDELDILLALKRALRKQNFSVYTASNGDDALQILADNSIDIIVSDLNMPGMTGIELLSKVSNEYPDIIRVMLTAHGDGELVLKAINEGRVWGYLQKPWDNNELVIVLNQALKARDEAIEKAILKQTLVRYQSKKKPVFEGFIGDSVVMQYVYSAIEKVSPSNASVFITGPSGTGKEVAATAIHHLSRRKDQALVVVNCAAIPSELMESEIFGHVKGAFSGATSDRDGLASLADGGTLFLDELGEMDILLQAKLLRFIQTGEFNRVGSGKTLKVDVRFIAATNRDPMQAIKDKLLREDLFYRLSVVSIDLPALKYRDDDVSQLATHFLKEFCREESKSIQGFSAEAQSLMASFDWPGNIRQLRNTIHSCVIMADDLVINDGLLKQQLKLKDYQFNSQNEDVAPTITPIESQSMSHPPSRYEAGERQILPLAIIERQAIEEAIESCDGNVVQAASSLGVSPSTLYRKIQSWND